MYKKIVGDNINHVVKKVNQMTYKKIVGDNTNNGVKFMPNQITTIHLYQQWIYILLSYKILLY